MSNLEVKLEKQDSRTEKKEALFRRMPSLRDLASECSSADVQDVILPSAIGRGKGSRGVYKKNTHVTRRKKPLLNQLASFT